MYDATLELEHAEEWVNEVSFMDAMDSVLEAADGCSVEPDGRCPHGYRSPLIVLGMI